MQKPPRPPGEHIYAGMIMKIISTGAVLAIAAFATQYWAVANGYDLQTQQTMVFTTLCFAQLCNALSVGQTSLFFLIIFSGTHCC